MTIFKIPSCVLENGCYLYYYVDAGKSINCEIYRYTSCSFTFH